MWPSLSRFHLFPTTFIVFLVNVDISFHLLWKFQQSELFKSKAGRAKTLLTEINAKVVKKVWGERVLIQRARVGSGFKEKLKLSSQVLYSLSILFWSFLFLAWLSCHWFFTNEQHTNPSPWSRWIPQWASLSTWNWNLLRDNTSLGKCGAVLNVLWSYNENTFFTKKTTMIFLQTFHEIRHLIDSIH